MPSGSWYLHRLRAMSVGEVCWRVASMARDRVDGVRFALGAQPAISFEADAASRLAQAAAPRLCDVQVGEWATAPTGSVTAQWRDRLIAAADAVVEHRVRVFNREVELGTPIEWNRDHIHGTVTPLEFSGRIDYRDRRVAGDAKIVWEPNRHQHLVILARAYRATGDPRYAHAVLAQLTSWLDQSPFAAGMNWRSPLELAIRLINWTWTLDLIRDAAVLTPAVADRVLRAIYLHLWDITRKFSRGSSANNHLIGEAAGVFVASTYFPELDRGGEWAAESQRILCHEIEAQTAADGGTREQAFGYHLFVFDLLLAAVVAGRALDVAFPRAFMERLELMAGFVAALAEGGPVPVYGDCDDGYALDLGRADRPVADVLAAGAALFDRADLAVAAGGAGEPVRWWFGRDTYDRCSAMTTAGLLREARPTPLPVRSLQSRALQSSGLYLLQCGAAGADAISAVVDSAPLGFTAIAAHGHADALSLCLRAFGQEVLVDPGTYDYFTYPDWRAYFKSTPAHNTVVIDGLDQSQQLGLFLWGSPATARCVTWEPSPHGGGSLTAEHDGYMRLADPVRHSRTVQLDASSRVLTIKDDLDMQGTHDVAVMFHFAEQWTAVAGAEPGEWRLTTGPQTIRLQLDPRLDGRHHRGSESPRAGWVSRGYHHKVAAPTIAGSGRFTGPTALECRVHLAYEQQ